MTTPYQRLLQDRLALLPAALGQFLADEHGGRATGRLKVTRAAGFLRNLAARALGIPPAGEYDLLLEVTPHAGRQRWVRRFGEYTLVTTQADHQGLLVEWSGPASIGFELVIEGGGLHFRARRVWMLGIPLPLVLAPGIEAENGPGVAGGWRVRIRFRLPLLGPVGEYEGEVLPRGGTEMANSNAARYRRWFEYEQDAHAKVLTSFDSVPADRRAGPEFQKAMTLFAHIVAARRMWLFRFGVVAAPPASLFPGALDAGQVAAEWREVAGLWSDYLARTDDAELAREFEYRSLDAGRFRNRIEDILTQLFGHSSYHRGQIAVLVRAAGGVPAVTDFVYWCREPMAENPA